MMDEQVDRDDFLNDGPLPPLRRHSLWPLERDMGCFPCRKTVRHKAVEMDQYPFVRYACVSKGHRDLHALTRPDYEVVQLALTGSKSPRLGL